MRPKPRRPRSSKLDPYTGYVDQRLDEGLENCVVLHRELRNLGYDGGYSILKSYVSPRRRRRQPDATVRFETAPGEQAQVDLGSLAYLGEDGKKRRIWVFVMTMGCSRACYVELVRRADTAAFIQCHVNAFEYLGGVPHRCLYDNAKVITLGRDEEKRPVWNQRMLDFALRVGFEARLCQPYRAQTKGKVERWGEVRPAQHVAQPAFYRRRRSEPAVPGVVRHGGQPESPRDDPSGSLGYAGRGESPPGQTAGAERLGPLPAGGPEGGPGRLRQLGGLPLRRPLEMGGKDGSGGPEAGHRGGLGRR